MGFAAAVIGFLGPVARTAVLGLVPMLVWVLPAFADLVVRFDEGAPKDRFSFRNTGDCAIETATLTLDLTGSKAGLIFDVTGSGAGVEVFQPLDIVAGRASLASVPTVRDGDQIVRFDIDELGAGDELAFTIDVDDTMGGREITVADAEIAGVTVSLVASDETASVTLTSSASGVVPLKDCA